MSANPINDLDDIKDIANLPMVRSLAFCDDDFAACQICEIPGYQEYVLTQVTSPYMECLDGIFHGHPAMQERRNGARNEYIESVIDLQKSLEEIDADHR